MRVKCFHTAGDGGVCPTRALDARQHQGQGGQGEDAKGVAGGGVAEVLVVAAAVISLYVSDLRVLTLVLGDECG